MFKFIVYILFFYLLYVFFKRAFLNPTGSKKGKVKDRKKQTSSLNINEDDIVDAKFKEINKEK